MNKILLSRKLLSILALSLALVSGLAHAQPAKELPAGSRSSG